MDDTLYLYMLFKSVFRYKFHCGRELRMSSAYMVYALKTALKAEERDLTPVWQAELMWSILRHDEGCQLVPQ